MKKPLVGIIMGSDSDLAVMQEAGKILDEFGVAYELTVVSAHRTPDRLYAYAKSAQKKGLKIIIAGAGGAAHLPGMTASITPLPVIGIPIKTAAMDGLDSLLSIAQMPAGIPVATVGIDNGKNAGLLAIQILGTADENVAKKLVDYKKKMADQVNEKAKKLDEMGYKKYLESK